MSKHIDQGIKDRIIDKLKNEGLSVAQASTIAARRPRISLLFPFLDLLILSMDMTPC